MRRVRHAAVALLVLGLAGAAFAGPAAQAAPGEDARRVVRYSVGSAGRTSADLATFRAVVDATLNDPRGWSLGGQVRFRRARRGAFRVTLATPAVIAAHSGCSAYYSCRSGSRVLVNEARWTAATPSYPGPSLLHPYRQHVINHEVGHALGFGHGGCPGAGRPAPVMQQQSKGLSGCARNPWPTAPERAALARRRRVRAAPPPPRLVLGRTAAGVTLGEPRAAVLARLGAPQRLTATAPGRSVESYRAVRLTVRYAGGRVVAATTRAAGDRSVSGLRVGVGERDLHRRLPGMACAVAADRSTVCVHAPPGPATGTGATTFFLRGGRVVAVRVERPGTAPGPGARPAGQPVVGPGVG